MFQNFILNAGARPMPMLSRSTALPDGGPACGGVVPKAPSNDGLRTPATGFSLTMAKDDEAVRPPVPAARRSGGCASPSSGAYRLALGRCGSAGSVDAAGLSHCSLPLLLRLVISRPTCSFVAPGPSRMPLTWPAHSTRMRSHSSSSTSRSSPTIDDGPRPFPSAR